MPRKGSFSAPLGVPATILASMSLILAMSLVVPTDLRAEGPFPPLLHIGSVQGVLGEASGGVQAQAVAAVAHMRDRGADLLLSCGNMWGPSVTSEIDGGRLAVEIMNRCRYDVMAVGPHDLFAGIGNFVARAAEIRCPLVWTNLKREGLHEGFGRVHDRVTLTWRDRTLRVFGIVDPEGMKQWPVWPAELVLEDPVACLEARRVDKGEGELAVVLASMAYSRAMELMERLPWVDLLVVHPIGTENLPAPSAFCHQTLDGRLILWSACHGASLAEIRLEAGEERRLVARPHAIARHPEADREMARRIDRLEARVRESAGETLVDLGDEAGKPLAPIFSDAMRLALGAEVAFLQSKAIRIETAPRLLTRAVVGRAFPFPDRAALFTVKGAELAAVWARRGGLGMQGAELVIVGLAEEGGKVLVNGRELDPDQNYRVATTEFIARGGLGVVAPRPGCIRDEKLTDLVADRLARLEGRSFRRAVHAVEERPIRRTRATVDASYNRLEFGGSAESYQYDDPNSTFADSDIPGLVGLAHFQYTYSLRLTHVLDAPESDLTLDFQMRYSRFKTVKTADRASFDVTYEDQSAADRGHLFGRLNFTGTTREPDLPAAERPLFGKAVGGLVWEVGRSAKLFVGMAGLRRFSVDGAPAEGGLSLRYTLDRTLTRGVNFRTDFDSFYSLGGAGIRTVDWSNQLRVQIRGGLSTLFKTTTYSWRDDEVGSTASRNELFVGLSWDRLLRRF